MCTVTIIPKGNTDFVLTSNRDEAPNRKSLPPKIYLENDTKLLFPMDELSGGTWVGLSEKNRVVCTLNGGFVKHEHKQNYRKSRGIVTIDFLLSENLLSTIETYNLENIEPFTMVLIDWNLTLKFYELVWDGETKHLVKLPLEPKIWSSSTLYNKTMKEERLQWFEDFKVASPLDAQSLLKFHKTTAINNKDYGIVMNRGFVKTTSITQIEKFDESFEMYHENLQNGTISSKTFKLSQVVNG
ncbi:NRDE family protein [Mariniflexile jejuense]|uniref:NRDE family protein n=1 Tax=Mariniflexile jejuense TaxID=1173582 RepID=A0ABW3JNN0_9FLAO